MEIAGARLFRVALPEAEGGLGADILTTLEVIDEIARAVEYLAGQSARGLTHELTLTPAGDRWLP